MELADFFAVATADEPCVGVRPGDGPKAFTPPAGIEYRSIDGSDVTTLEGLFDAFAAAWRFPPRFAHRHGKDAFEDWMRDLDNLTNPSLSEPPARGYFTEISEAHQLLIAQPDHFDWFAKSIPFFRDSYRDEADPPAAFGLLLSTSEVDAVRERWHAAGIEVILVTG